jgi:uncharacterized membrane protein
VMLVPVYGPHGAAAALMVASVVACLAFMALGRRWYRMPIDLIALAVLPSIAAICVFGAHTIAAAVPGQTARLALDALLFAACSGFAIRHFGLLNLASMESIDGLTVP